MPSNKHELDLTVVVTVVAGKQCLRNHLMTLCPQVRFIRAEVLVPYDNWSADVGDLAAEFPDVGFLFSDDLGLPEPDRINGSDHRLYDRRRSIGLRQSRGTIIALTEDQALPADDWVAQMLTAHEQPYEVIGGAVENGIERPINRAVYFCDFGRYGRPFRSREVSYVSDVNLAYKREALTRTLDLWKLHYHETTVNWALQSLGKRLYLDSGPVVYQCRPDLSFWKAVKERVAWGRVFARTRAERLTYTSRLLFVGATFLLPAILLFRALQNMIRQGQKAINMLVTLPVVSVLVVCWSAGELAGYLTDGTELEHPVFDASGTNDAIRNRALG